MYQDFRDHLTKLRNKYLSELAEAQNNQQLEELRAQALGKKSVISQLLKTLGAMSGDERQIKGPLLNQLKEDLQNAFSEKTASFKQAILAKKLKAEWQDITLPVDKSPALLGRIHPISQVLAEISAIFAGQGFTIAEGPDIESDYYNFTALNFPEDHPARQMHDTFFLKTEKNSETMLLRTHTSPVQIRTMRRQKPPIKIIIPGKTYRMDFDATHSPMFHQVEGLVIDKNIHIGHLKGVLQQFCQSFFEVENLKMRFRPSYFPFTEPSMEVDIQCARKGNEIKIGTGDDWLEILGCGMVHPNVLRHGGIDPEQYQGFAWGLGLDRITMLKYGIADLRAFFESDQRWLEYYGFNALDVPTMWNGLSGALLAKI